MSIVEINVQAERLLITPGMAEEWLAGSRHNRPLNEPVAMGYALEMEAGTWRFNGDSIRFSKSGRLLDGQHRLKACTLSGIPFSSIVVRGLDDETFDTMDVGRKRRPSDMVAIKHQGVERPTIVANAARLLAGYEYDKLERSLSGVTPQVMLATLDKHPNLIASVAEGARMSRLLNTGAATFLHYLFARKDRAAADKYFEDLRTGTSLERDDPVHLYRERLIDERWDRNHHTAQVEKIRAGINAWNARRTGRTFTRLPSKVRTGPNLPDVE